VELQVECYSGYEYAQRPVAFWWQQERLEVAELLAEMSLPAAKRFIVKTRDHRRWVIEYQIDLDAWFLVEMINP
jgi:hypothetical protein